MTSLLSIPALLLLTLPWLNPLASGPSPPVVPWLVTVAAAGGLMWLAALRRVWARKFAESLSLQRWAEVLAWALVVAGLASSAMGLLQYFGAAAALEPWIRAGTYGEAFANLRQRNQFASLTNMALVALVWLAVHRRTALANERLSGLWEQRFEPLWLLAAPCWLSAMRLRRRARA